MNFVDKFTKAHALVCVGILNLSKFFACDVWLKLARSKRMRGKQKSTSARAWNDWYHITVHTYCAWLRGDSRGWRARHHREHVDGDYRNPPAPGEFDHILAQSERLMKRDAVRITNEIRQFVANALAEKLIQDGIEVLIVTVDGKHAHVLARFIDHNPRHWIGRVKKHTSHSVRQNLLRDQDGGLWGKRCGVEPITAREHEVNAFDYILDHVK